MYPKSRLDALTDGIFAVAMTILVLDLKLPEGSPPVDASAMAHALQELWPKFLPYALSFFVLGLGWLSMSKFRADALLPRRYALWWLPYLLLATCLPFTTTVVGRFAHLPPAIWLYAANMAGLAAMGYRLIGLMPDVERDQHVLDRKLSLAILMTSCALSVIVSLINPAMALWIYVLNIAAPKLTRWIANRQHARDGKM